MLGDRIKQLRKEHGLTQAQLAEILNIKKTTISNYETGYSTPSNEMLKNLANVLDASTDYLLERTNNPDLTEKDEDDIAKTMNKLKKNLINGKDKGVLAFYGRPLSDEAIESMLIQLEAIERQTKIINKKYIPKKYKKGE
ncbi:helix-turn-helix domain-containing protein [Sporolactobacillus sp. KGMB 08714]|uniref:helix-turn-helix domain-containing protein n=1 Tax=unclassified Sporolactobacillus TaxID=2628533 RepID=UPI0023679374|nr:helix-turn-helix transcriptional regulator [Sporolactobacillus sp. CQH2019]MDD9146927.1 helix-turn-helix transcriptional regulator [Sporolactobacillus sp. CQH2019]